MVNSFEYCAPATLAEAIGLGRGEEAYYMAGGTDLLVKAKRAQVRPRLVVDLKAVDGLASIREEDGRVVIGALTTIRSIETSPVIRAKLPLLAQAAGMLGSVQVRHRATIGGNLCNAAPSAETAPALLCLEAALAVAGPGGTRTVPLAEFFAGPGQTVLAGGEIVTGVIVPAAPGRGVYYKLSVRRAMDIAFVGLAVYLELAGSTVQKARIALGAVAPTPIRARVAEAMLEGRPLTADAARAAGARAAGESSPISDIRAGAAYRREMVDALTARGLLEVYAKAERSVDG